MRAEIVSVGTELLLGQIVDTNAVYLSRLLPELGIDLYYRWTVGDNACRLADTLRASLIRADIVFTSGGLGPTEDDLTRETVAQVVGDSMRLDEDSVHSLRAFFDARGVEMTGNNLKQALAPVKGRLLPNPNGTAPGAVFETADGKAVIVLPGPPREFVPMVDGPMTNYLREKVGSDGNIIKSRLLRLAGIGESTVEDKIKHLLKSDNPTVAPLASLGEVHLRITAKAKTEREALELIDEMDSKLVSELGDRVFGRDEQTLEEVVVRSLVERSLTLAIAESCTGGLISNRITNVPGSSEMFLAGEVTYSNESKMAALGVDDSLIRQYGAVSEQTACAMAEGVRARFSADIGLSTTGIAGPGGATKDKPVGLVYIGLSSKDQTTVKRLNLFGNRLDVKMRASQSALDMIRALLDKCPD